MPQQRFFYCPKCGAFLHYEQRHDMQRLVCRSCSYVLYENPVVGVAAIVLQDNSILLGRRSQTSTYPGLWCIPCGYVEYEEDVYDAIKREFREETGLEIEITGVFTALSNFHNPSLHTVGIWFKATITGGRICPGDDVDRVDWFELERIPAMAFPTDIRVIEMLKRGSH